MPKGNYTVERETRGGTVRWVHVRGDINDFNQNAADRMCNTEARKWAAELGMTAGSWVSGGGEYGPKFRHSLCFTFKPKSDS
ncbi:MULTISPECIES: hypothetical protein [unclassified Kitasatospora]|uniref:hypothetical protein n=1 Tax=unclassified Kitasatospora TaxID=2633591 RepID=UPI0038136367